MAVDAREAYLDVPESQLIEMAGLSVSMAFRRDSPQDDQDHWQFLLSAFWAGWRKRMVTVENELISGDAETDFAKTISRQGADMSKAFQEWPCDRCGKVIVLEADPESPGEWHELGGLRVFRRTRNGWCRHCGKSVCCFTTYEIEDSDLGSLQQDRRRLDELQRASCVNQKAMVSNRPFYSEYWAAYRTIAGKGRRVAAPVPDVGFDGASFWIFEDWTRSRWVYCEADLDGNKIRFKLNGSEAEVKDLKRRKKEFARLTRTEACIRPDPRGEHLLILVEILADLREKRDWPKQHRWIRQTAVALKRYFDQYRPKA